MTEQNLLGSEVKDVQLRKGNVLRQVSSQESLAWEVEAVEEGEG